MNLTPEREEFLVIPTSRLSNDAVDGLIEEFILREGTDYGHADSTLEQKKARVHTQIANGHVVIVYSSITENTSLMKKDQLADL